MGDCPSSAYGDPRPPRERELVLDNNSDDPDVSEDGLRCASQTSSVFAFLLVRLRFRGTPRTLIGTPAFLSATVRGVASVQVSYAQLPDTERMLTRNCSLLLRGNHFEGIRVHSRVLAISAAAQVLLITTKYEKRWV